MQLEFLGWLGFCLFIVGMLVLDIRFFHRTPHVVHYKEALLWSIFWVLLALIFNAGIFIWKGTTPGIEFFTGYLIEKSLSLDNVFVFAVIFAHFGVPLKYQHRVLFLGILGAIVFRMVFILAGIELIRLFDWVFYIFGAFLIFTAVQTLQSSKQPRDLSHSKFLVWLRRFVPLTADFHEQRFFIRHNGKLMATPLLLVLIFIELSDVLFALDSIPAIFAITQDAFIIFTSNIFAILGLRSLYFLLAGSLHKFYYLKHAISFILFFIGLKLIAMHHYKIPLWLSLSVIVVTLISAILASLLREQKMGKS
jgi:tellurite resistance protein TerC